MKTSKIILISSAGIFTIMLVISLFILKKDVQDMQETNGAIKYQAVEMVKFTELDVSSAWSVKIRQGRNHKVELEALDHIDLDAYMSNKDGILRLTTDSSMLLDSAQLVHARITLPVLNEIRAVSGSRVHVENFTSDSLHVVLEDGCGFTGKTNTIKRLFISTKGSTEVRILTSDWQ